MKKNRTTLITTRKGIGAALFLLLVFFFFSCSKGDGDRQSCYYRKLVSWWR
jgi:hypothetical protein